MRFGFMHFKNAEQVRELQDGPGRLGKTVQGEARILVTGNLEALHQRGDAGAVHVFNAGHINKELRHTALLKLRKDGLADLGRIEESDVADEVKDSDAAELASGNFECGTWGQGRVTVLPSFARDWRRMQPNCGRAGGRKGHPAPGVRSYLRDLKELADIT